MTKIGRTSIPSRTTAKAGDPGEIGKMGARAKAALEEFEKALATLAKEKKIKNPEGWLSKKDTQKILERIAPEHREVVAKALEAAPGFDLSKVSTGVAWDTVRQALNPDGVQLVAFHADRFEAGPSGRRAGVGDGVATDAEISAFLRARRSEPENAGVPHYSDGYEALMRQLNAPEPGETPSPPQGTPSKNKKQGH